MKLHNPRGDAKQSEMVLLKMVVNGWREEGHQPTKRLMAPIPISLKMVLSEQEGVFQVQEETSLENKQVQIGLEERGNADLRR